MLIGLHMFFEDSIISVLDRFLLIIICSSLLWGGFTSNVFHIEWFVYAQTVSYFISACVALKMLEKKNRFFKNKLGSNIFFSYYKKILALCVINITHDYLL